MSFIAERADSDKVYQSSNVAASMIGTSGTLCLQYGVMVEILELSLSHSAAPCCVSILSGGTEQSFALIPKCSNVMLIKASATVSPWT